MKTANYLFKHFENFLPIILVLLAALLLRLPLLGGSFWLDEAAQALESARPLAQQLEIIPDFQPPLLHLITHFALYFSQAEWWLRLIGALIPGMITIWATYQIGKKLLSKSVGLLAGLFLATNSFHIFYSQELRPYSLQAMFAMLSWLIIVKWQQLRSPVRFWLFAVVTALGMYSTYLYPFVLATQIAYVFIFKTEYIKRFVSAASLGVLAFVPWLPTFFRQLEQGQFVRSSIPGWDSVVSLPQLKALPLTIGKFIYGVIHLDVSLAFIIPTLLILAVLTVLLASWLLTETKTAQRQAATFTLWFLLPLLSAWIISFVIPVVRPKRLLFLLPIMYLFISAVVIPHLQKTTSFRGGLALLATVILLLINVGSTLQYYSSPDLQRENWRGLYRQMTTQYPAEDSVAVYVFPQAFAPIRWYDTENYPAVSLGELHVDQVDNLAETLKPVTEYQYVLLFDYLTDLTDPNQQVLQTIQGYGYHQAGQLEYPNIGFVRILTKEATVTAQLNQN